MRAAVSHEYESRGPTHTYTPASTYQSSHADAAPQAPGPSLDEKGADAVAQLDADMEGVEAAFAAMPRGRLGWSQARDTLRATLATARTTTDAKRFLAAAHGDAARRRNVLLARLRAIEVAEAAMQLPNPTVASAAVPDTESATTPPLPQYADERQGHVGHPSTAPGAAPTPGGGARDFLHRHRIQLWLEIQTYLHAVSWPDVDPRARWISEAQFGHELVTSVHVALNALDQTLVREVFYPLDPLASVESYCIEGALWNPAISSTFARLLQQATVMSLRRLVPRLVRAADALGPAVSNERHLIESAPIDAFVKQALLAPGVITTEHAVGVEPIPLAALRPVTLHWMGPEDAALWNYVRCDQPGATVEEVAAHLYATAARPTPSASASVYAYGIVAAGPLFRLPTSWARAIDEARQYAPSAALDRDETIATGQLAIAELGGSTLASELALAEAAGEPAPVYSADALADRFRSCGLQLDQMSELLHAWGLSGQLLPAMLFASARSVPSARMSEVDRTAWSKVADVQNDRLFEIAGSLARVPSAQATTATSSPFFHVVEAYAAAASASHLGVTSRALIARAHELESGLTIAALRDNLAAAENQRALATGVAGTDAALDGQSALYAHTMQRGQQLMTELVNGDQVDAVELQGVEIDAQKLALLAEVHRLQIQLDHLDQAGVAAEAGVVGHMATAFFAGLDNLRKGSEQIHRGLGAVLARLAAAGIGQGVAPIVGRAALDKARVAVGHGQDELAALKSNAELDRFLASAYTQIHSLEVRKQIITFAEMLALAITASTAGAAVAASISGQLTTAAGLSAAGELAAGIGAAATEVTITAAGQSLLTGQSMASTLVDNAVFTGASMGVGWLAKNLRTAELVVGAYEAQLAALAAVEGQVAARAAKSLPATAAKWVMHETLAVTGHAILGMAVGEALTLARGGTVDDATWSDLLSQSAAITIGRYVGASIAEHHATTRRLAEASRSTRAADLVRLEEEALRFAKVVERGRDASQALDLMERKARILEETLALLKDPATFAHAGDQAPSAAELAEMEADLQSQVRAVKSDTMLEVSLRLRGLEELVPGTTWRGTHEEIYETAAMARRLRRHVEERWEPERGLATLTIDGRAIQIYERARPPTKAQPAGRHELSTEVAAVAGSQMRPRSQRANLADLEHAVTTAIPSLAPMVGAVAIVPEGSGNTHTYIVTLESGAQTSVEIVFAEIAGGDLARLVANSSRRPSSSRTGIIEGEHVLQLSSALSPADVERGLAHGVARLLAVHERALAGDYASGVTPGALRGDQIGRLAELRVLARELTEHPQRAAAIHREAIALAAELGIRAGRDGEAALERVSSHLDEAGRELLVAAQRAKPRERALVESAILEDQQQDLERAARRTVRRPEAYVVAGPGHQARAEQLQAFADAAARHRALVSEHTVADLRARAAKMSHGNYVQIDKIQVGGGAALAGRDPGALLVDARGRWQADGGDVIAQTGQQLTELAKASFGDVRQVADPDQRVPLSAIRFWEDTLATRGAVIDGVVVPRMDGRGRVLMDITVAASGEVLTVEVKGNRTFATGFVPEAIPGSPRIPIADAVFGIEARLKLMDTNRAATQPLKDAAARAAARIRSIEHPTRADAEAIAHALEGPYEVELKQWVANSGLGEITSIQEWHTLEARRPQGARQVALGDGANLAAQLAEMFPDTPGAWHPEHVVIGGTSGTGISAAELVLKHADVRVTMVGRDSPDGLLKNTQFMELGRKYGTPELIRSYGLGVERATVRPALDVEVIGFYPGAPAVSEDANGHLHFKVDPRVPIAGDAYIGSVGRPPQLPPAVADLVLWAKRNLRPVKYRVLTTLDDRYVGYRVMIKNGEKTVNFDVTGAASRQVPTDLFSPEGQAIIRRAEREDAHGKSGNFSGGFASTAVQGSSAAGTIKEVL